MASPNLTGPANIMSILQNTLAPSRSVSSSVEALALLCHSAMLAVGFQFLGTDEETSSSTTLPDFAASQSHFSFRYKHPQSALSPFLLTVTKLGPKGVISALSEGNDEHTVTFDVRISDVILSPPAVSYPLAPSVSFITSEQALADFVTLFKKQVIQSLVPSLQKEGYTEERTAPQPEEDSHDDRPPPPYSDRSQPERQGGYRPDTGVPRIPAFQPDILPRISVPSPLAGPPGFEDEYEILNGPRGGLQGYPGRSPFSIGDDDLNPPGLRNPGFSPGLTSPFGGAPSGMYPGDDHPLFAGRRGNGGSGLGSGAFRPPGARFDEPFDPSGAPDPGRGLGLGRRGFPGPGSGGLGGPGGGIGGFGSGGGGFGGYI